MGLHGYTDRNVVPDWFLYRCQACGHIQAKTIEGGDLLECCDRLREGVDTRPVNNAAGGAIQDWTSMADFTGLPVLGVDFNMPRLMAQTGTHALTVGQRVRVDDYDSIRATAIVTAFSREKSLAYLHVEGELEHYGPNA